MIQGMLGAAAQTQNDLAPDLDPPTGAPVAGVCSVYSGSLTVVQWANGDTSAQTEIGLSVDPLIDPTGREAIVAKGITSYETGVSTRCAWFVRHIKEAGVTAWVYVPHERGCTENPDIGTGGGSGQGGGDTTTDGNIII